MSAKNQSKNSLLLEIEQLKTQLLKMEEKIQAGNQAAAQSFQENQTRLANIVESAMDAILSVDSQQNILVFNKAAERMFQCPAANAIGHPLIRFIPERFHESHQKQVNRYGSTGISSRRMGSLGTISGLRSNGEEFPIEAAISQSEGDREKIFTVILRDITERKKAEEALKESEEFGARMATILEQMADLVVVTDTTGKIIYVNRACEQICGYSDFELIGEMPRVFKSDRHDPKFFENMWQTIIQGNIWSGHITNRRKDGSLSQESMLISPVRDKEGKIISFVSIRREIGKQLTLEEQFRQVQKMEAIGRLAGGVAHDFNNILTVINGLSELLMFDALPGSPNYLNLKEIHQAGEKAAHLTRQLLTFSRKQLVETRVSDLNRTVASMDQMLRRLIGEDIELITVLGSPLAPIEMNPGNIEQVIINLAVNARDAMPDGGKLILETAHVELDEAYASLHAEMKPGIYVMLAITDTGHGMSPEIQSKIFEPFFTTKEVGKGTGLGLSTVYGIVQNHHGHIWVYSEKGRGTIFKIYFPVASDQEEPLVTPEEISVLKGDKNVLLVEDDESVRRLGKMILDKAGFRVFEAKDGREALKMANTLSEKVDILVTDVVMPHLSGRQLAEQIKKMIPDIKVLFVSGYTNQAFAHNDDLKDGNAFLQKPFTAEGIIKKIHEVFQQ